MREIGLQPTSTGEPGGKETGQSVTHYIMPEGRYARAYAKLAATGFQLHWQSLPASKHAKAKKSSKTKFTCPECGQNAWAKLTPCSSAESALTRGKGISVSCWPSRRSNRFIC